MTTEDALVATAMGDLKASVFRRGEPVRVGLVLMDGSGPGTRNGWGGWPQRFADCGAVVLTHDKPGCGGSPGSWLEQGIADRAEETVQAVRTLRSRLDPSMPIGLAGFSQGGWVAMQAAIAAPSEVHFIVTVSGPGVAVHVQERVRISRDLGDDPALSANDIAAAMDWIDERTRQLRAGDPVAEILARQDLYRDRSWFALAVEPFDTLETLTFLGRIMDFDPRSLLPEIKCPVLGLFGAADRQIPVRESVTAFAELLPQLPGNPHGVAVFPGADHGLFVPAVTADGGPGTTVAPGVLPMVNSVLRDRVPLTSTPRPAPGSGQLGH